MDYTAQLEASGVRPVLLGPWAVVGHATREQGWKLHVSTIPIEASSLLDAVVPLLHKRGVSFKLARDESVLRQLNEGALGATQIGKFLTIYPKTNRDARGLALALVSATRGFVGPVILTDSRLGDVVYARYGPFRPRVLRDRLGNISIAIRLPGGDLVPHTYSVPFEAPQGRINPFRDMVRYDKDLLSYPSEDRLFGPGYIILDVVRANPRGSVFLAMDARLGSDRASLCVIKEGRMYCCSDSLGRDMRSRLKQQAAILSDLSGKVSVPTAAPYFEVAGNGYLPLEYIPGADVAHDLRGPFGSLEREAQRRILSRLIQISQVVGALHGAGYVHRDLKPSNFRLTPDEHLYIVDLELAHSLGSAEVPFGKGTPGFMSPQQQAEEAPAIADDVYGLGAVTLYLLTGIHPLRLLFSGKDVDRTQIAELAQAPRGGLIEVVARCLATSPEPRPSVRALELVCTEAVNNLDRSKVRGGSTRSRPQPSRSQRDLGRILPLTADGLLHDVLLDPELGLWLSQAPDKTGRHALTAPDYRLYRSANRGVAGVIYCLARLARHGYSPPDAKQRVSDAIDWLLAHAPTPDDQLQGLHFGEAGVAVAVAEAIRSELIERDGWLSEYLADALYGALDWPDLTHGAAGQGIAALCCADILDEPDLAAAAHRCAAFLIASQEDDGGWTTPPGVEGLSGSRLTGFAHGAAGIIYFLCEYSARSGSAEARNAALNGASWLRARARTSQTGDSLEWTTREGEEDVWRWWCHGAPGIALAWLKLFEHYRTPEHLSLAIRSLRSHPIEARYSNLSLCHGLSGLGEIYLEANRLLREDEWLLRAERIANVLLQLARPTDNGVAWLVEDAFAPTGDLMVGCAGIAHFLLRLRSPDSLSFPLLP